MRVRPMTLACAALFGAAGLMAGCGVQETEGPEKPAASKSYAVLTTSMGVIKVRLFLDEAPKTCRHFMDLATGDKAWRDPRDGQMKKKPLYDGLVFHRVIPGFMIQTGDPLGDGRGGIGYTIADEFHPRLRYDRPGLLGMAGVGPDSVGSQFFITLDEASMLNDRHTLFGEVVEGLDVAKAIAAVPRDESGGLDRPLKPVTIKSLRFTGKL